MKKILPFLLMLFIFEAAFSQDGKKSSDSASAKASTQTEMTNNGAKAEEKKSSETPSGKPDVQSSPTTSTTPAAPAPVELTVWQKIFILMPVLLFFLVAFVLKICARKWGVILIKAVLSEEPEQVERPSEADPAQTIKVTRTDANGNPVHYPSSSRLIALLTSLLTMIVISCFTSYYAYCMVRQIPFPEFKNLFEVMIGLGLGIVPYSVKKIADASKPTNQ